MAGIDFSSINFLNPAVYAGKQSDNNRKLREKTAPPAAKRLNFAKMLEESSESAGDVGINPVKTGENVLTELLEAVENAGKALLARPMPDEIQAYKMAVGGFLRFIEQNAFSVEHETAPFAKFKQPGQKKAFSALKVVDEKLRHLAEDIMTGQIKQIKLLERIQEINGILVDLMVGGSYE
jgi:uncharacterized protein YaaR (DUF327 family)